MSWGTCYSGCNNIHFDFPPIMSDGRNFARWQPGSIINEEIKVKENIKTNWQYRQYLTNNADNIIKYNQMSACDQCCSCPARYGDGKEISNSPFLYKSCVESTQPYGYENSNLKNLYIDEYKLQCRLVTPVITQEQLLKGKFPNYN